MIKNITVVSDGDIVSYTVSYMGCEWNEAADVTLPLRDCENFLFVKEDIEAEEDLCETLCEILVGFMDHHKIDKMYYVGNV